MKLKRWLVLMCVISLAAVFSLGPTQARVSDRPLSSMDQPLAAPTADIIVTTTNDELNNDGDCSLREAVEAANCDCPVDACPAGSGGDIIVLDYETYLLDLVGAGEDANQTGDLDIQGGSAIRIESWTSLTTVNGNATDRVFHIHPGAFLELVNLTVTNGRADGEGGGGIYNQGVLVLDTVWVSNNVTTGAVPGGYGGGIYNEDGSLSIENSYIVGNEIQVLLGCNSQGGGIYSVDGSVAIHATNIAGNKAPSHATCGYLYGLGGGVRASGGDVTITHSLINQNESGHGGGILTSANTHIANSIINHNSAEYGGGGIWLFGDAPLTLIDSTVSNNTSEGGGGGLNAWAGGVYLTNTTISGNSSGSSAGGGLFVEENDTHVELVHVTMVDNEGGGIYYHDPLGGDADIHLDNTLSALNTGGDDCLMVNGNPPIDEGHNFIGDGSCGFPAGGDPLVGPLQDNGGPMAGLYQSNPVETHALLPGSPAIDAGDCAGGTVPADQRGVERPQDGDGVGGAACDIGAYERWIAGVLFDEAHDEWKTLDAARADDLCPGIIPWCAEGDEDYVLYTDLEHNLADEFALVQNEAPLTDALLSNYAALMITVNQAPLTPAEELAVRQFVAQGGGLVWIADCGYWNPNPDLAAAFGLEFLPQCLFNLPYTGNLDGDLFNFVYPAHEANRFATGHYINWGANLERLDTDVTARIAYTGPDVWEDTNFSDAYEPGEDRAGEQFLVAAAYDEGCGRVLALSDDAYSNMFLGGTNNEDYMRSLLRWVVGGQVCEPYTFYVPVVFKSYGP